MRVSEMIFRMMCLQFLVVGTVLFADALDEDAEEEEISIPFDTSSSLYQDMNFSDPKVTQEGTAYTWQSKKGKADVSVGVENVDQLSQWQHEWDKKTNSSKKKKEKKKGSGDNDRDEEEDHSPSAHISIQWNSKNK